MLDADATDRAEAARRPSFKRRYTEADVALLAEVDAVHEDLSGLAVRHLLEREVTVYGNEKFRRLAGISVSHIYNLRKSAGYRKLRVRVQHTQARQISIAERRQPDPKGKPGYLRVDTVHQGQQDGKAGVYHINAVDTVTQWEVVGCVEREADAEDVALPVSQAHSAEEKLRAYWDTKGAPPSEQLERLLAKLGHLEARLYGDEPE